MTIQPAFTYQIDCDIPDLEDNDDYVRFFFQTAATVHIIGTYNGISIARELPQPRTRGSVWLAKRSIEEEFNQ